jgi:hypothetical protein
MSCSECGKEPRTLHNTKDGQFCDSCYDTWVGDADESETEITQLRTELEAMTGAITVEEPENRQGSYDSYWGDWPRRRCSFCNTLRGGYNVALKQEKSEPHKDDCAIMQARAIREREGWDE